ncbi:MAG: hypothetical protein HY903_17360 [Deltaproteobacteria bacterium]|nr:hypothetical protein [Deltaproteobacteria bacterium]
MSIQLAAMPLVRTYSRVNQARLLAEPTPTVKITKAEATRVVRRIAKIDEALASHYHVRGADARFQFQMLKEKKRLLALIQDGRPGNTPFDRAILFSKNTVEATLDYVRALDTQSHSALAGGSEGFTLLARRLLALVRGD